MLCLYSPPAEHATAPHPPWGLAPPLPWLRPGEPADCARTGQFAARVSQ